MLRSGLRLRSELRLPVVRLRILLLRLPTLRRLHLRLRLQLQCALGFLHRTKLWRLRWLWGFRVRLRSFVWLLLWR